MREYYWVIGGGTIYFVLFVLSIAAVGKLLRKRNRRRAPIEFKLLRSPGHTLRLQVRKFDEDLLFYLGAAAGFPVVVAGAIFSGLVWLNPHTRLIIGVPIIALTFFIAWAVSGRWLWKKLSKASDQQLGYLGECTVGEALLPLLKTGHSIFHDVPAESGKQKFNLDHVVVGSTGVFLIETKTRRKGGARQGYKDHEVGYDGRRLIWPWGEDIDALVQAEREARWLSDWLNKVTGLGITAKPILALPGWFVKATAIGTVNVVNAKGLPSAVKGRGQRILTDEQIDLIARQLDQKCRDVEE